MIPPVIHCGMFGDYTPSYLDMECMISWRRVMPEASVKIWNSHTSPVNEFTRCANPINMSNYMKFWTLYNFGGVFLDFDVEVVKPFDLTQEAFVGFQKTHEEQDCINTAVLGSRAGHVFVGDCLKEIEKIGGHHKWPVDFGCGIPTAWLYANGMKGVNSEQTVRGVKVYTTDRFYPWLYGEKATMDKVTERTYAIHHWEGSWKK